MISIKNRGYILESSINTTINIFATIEICKYMLTIKRLTSADGTRNISANDVNRVYDVVIENNSIMSEENLISINDVVEVEKLKEDKSNIDIAKTYKIQIKKYKSNGSISEIIVKENTENFNIIEETMPGTGE